VKPCPVCTNDDINHFKVCEITHKCGNKEFKLLCYKCGTMYGSIGFNAVGGDEKKAYERLITDWNGGNNVQ